MTGASSPAPARDASLIDRYREIRAATEALAAPLSAEDCQLQSMPDASPVKWHLAHLSWFFETFLLTPYLPDYSPIDPAYAVLFNSYYVGVGERHPRPERGLLSRPTLDQVYTYRRHVDAAMTALIDLAGERHAELIELGLQHEQQHQELILMDIQHAFSRNPAEPAYALDAPTAPYGPGSAAWIDQPGGLYAIGKADGEASDPGFAFDNEYPQHRVWIEPFAIADRLVTIGDYADFIDDGGYARPELWLSDGWAAAEAGGWQAPLYWRRDGDAWTCFSLRGRGPVDRDAPVLHISYYEADAFARWRGCRLPTEAEWEVAADGDRLNQIFDSAWQWTASPYVGYPGFHPAEGAVGEYNGKFMVNQFVLRGGCLATPTGHSRATYRNFYPPSARWMFSGIRLARDA